jgi:hypothetical protein
MPQLALQIGNEIQKPSGGIYEASDIGRVEVKEELLTVEMILTDPVLSNTSGKSASQPVETNRIIAGTLENLPTVTSYNNTNPDPIAEGPKMQVFPTTGNRPTGPMVDVPLIAKPGLPFEGPVTCELPPNPTDPASSIGTGSLPPYLRPPFSATPDEPLPPKGSLFFEPSCDTCCHSPTDSPSQFYTLCLMVVTDPVITSMIEKGMIDQVYSSIPALQAKFDKGDPGAYLQETSFLDFTSQQVASLVKSDLFAGPAKMLKSEPSLGGLTGQKVIRSELEMYQFQRNFSFKIPKNCQHIALFTFIRLDDASFNEYFKTPNLSIPQGVYTGPIKELVVVNNSNVQTTATAFVDLSTMSAVTTAVQRTKDGSYYTFNPTKVEKPRKLAKVFLPVGNIRSSQILDKLIKTCSTSLTDAIQSQGSIKSSKIQKAFWLSKASVDTNILFMMFNQEQLIMENSLIRNLKTRELYAEQQLETFEVEKIDVFDEDKNQVINSTVGIRSTIGTQIRGSTYAKTKILDDSETINDDGGRVVLSTLSELPSLARAIKFVQIVDNSPSPGKFSYRFVVRFKDPTIEFLKSVTNEYMDRMDKLVSVYKQISLFKEDIKKGTFDSSLVYKQAIDAAKSAISKAKQILSVLPNNDFNPTLFINYASMLANPKASKEDHDDLIKILRTLEQTLVRILRNAGIPIKSLDSIGPTTDNLRSSTSKQKAIITVEIQTQTFDATKGTGIDFLTIGNNNNTAGTSAIVYDTKFLDSRADAEFSKFWNSTSGSTSVGTENILREKAKFFLTPSKVYGIDETINFDRVQNYDSLFEQKIKKLKLARERKSSKSSTFNTITDSLDNLPASFQIVPSEYDFQTIENFEQYSNNKSEFFLRNQTNFTQDNISTAKNKSKQVNQNDTLSDKILTSIEAAFVDGFSDISEGSIPTTIKSQTSIEQVVDRYNLDALPPSLQSYKLRGSEASKFFTFVQQSGLLSEPSNQIYLKNYFGIVGKIQFASFKPSDLSSMEWRDLDTASISANKTLFCRIQPIEDNILRIGLGNKETEIYNEFFVLQTDSRSNKVSNNASSIRQVRMLRPENTSKSENVVGNRIRAIMEQKTTYNSGVPVAYTNIVH